MQIFLIRHPPPLVAAGVCYGRLDCDAVDAERLAARLRGVLPIATPVLASPLRRTRRLAEALHPQALFDRRLMEIDFGDWEGIAWEAIERTLIDAWAADMLHFAPPGGESAAMLQARVVACVADCLASASGPALALVTHAGAIRALIGYWLHLPIDAWCRLPVDFGSVTLLEVDTGMPGVLHYLNR